MKLKVVVLPPSHRLVDVCSPECREWLERHFEPVWNETGRDYTQEELAQLLVDADILLSSWGSPPVNEAMLQNAPRLRVIGHAAGSVKHLVPKSVFTHGIAVFSAAPRIARSVAEYCLTCALYLLRPIHSFDAAVRGGNWKVSGIRSRELTGKTVGIIAASSTAREFIKLLAPFDVTIKVYDPYLTDHAAQTLRVCKESIEQVMQSDIVSVHAPAFASTHHLVNRNLLRLIPDGAILINSSRGSVIDEQALIDELSTERFSAALDVFSEEPLPVDHPLKKRSNVLLTPHNAADTKEGHLALMKEVVQDIVRYLNGETETRYRVDAEMWDIRA